MKKKNLFLIFIILLGVTSLTIQGQVVDQDAEGKGTILFPGGTACLDIGETALSINFMDVKYQNGSKGFIWGVNARTENKSGIGKLFESGKIVPGNMFLVTYGLHWSPKPFRDMAYMAGLEKNENKIKAEIEQSSKEMDSYIKKSKEISKSLKKIFQKEYIVDELNKLIEEHCWNMCLEENLNDWLAKNKNYLQEIARESELENVIKEIIKIFKSEEVQSLIKKQEDNYDELEKTRRLRIRINLEKNTTYKRYVLFTRLGVNASSFKLYIPSECPDLKDQFKKIEHTNVSFQIGANMQLGGGLLFGLAAGFQKANNLGTLDKKEFCLNTTKVAGNQELVQEEKIIAYCGEFKKFDCFDIDADMVCFFRLGDLNVITPYGYLRWRIPTGVSHSMPNTANVGIGANLFTVKGKHLGGFFIELSDITNELKKESKFLNRLTLGIIIKVTFAKNNSWIPAPNKDV